MLSFLRLKMATFAESFTGLRNRMIKYSTRIIQWVGMGMGLGGRERRGGRWGVVR